MRCRLIAATAGSVLIAVAALVAQIAPGSGCLHKDQETTMQRERRLEAIDALRLIDRAVSEQRPWIANTTWEKLAGSASVRSLQADGEKNGDLARKIRWGQVEPLPGWRILWTNGPIPTFSLTDVWDPCRFTLSSEDREVIPHPRAGTIPLATK